MVPTYPPCYWGACTIFVSGIRVRSGRTHTKVGTYPSPPVISSNPPTDHAGWVLVSPFHRGRS